MAVSKKKEAASKAASPATSSKAKGMRGRTTPKTEGTKAKVEAKTKPTAKVKKAAPAKLTDKQRALLAKIQDAGAAGYEAAGAAELRSILSLSESRLVKKAASKEKGKPRFLLSKIGLKRIAPAAAPAPPSAPGPMPPS